MHDVSTAYAKGPAPRRRSFAGAVVLIAIGVVFLLGNMHVITWKALFFGFARYWPVLLILYGVIKLIEYSQARKHGEQFRGLGAGGVVLMIFLILLGLTATGLERARNEINWNALNGDVAFDGDFGGFLGNTYTFSQEVQQNFPAGATVKVVSDRGSVNIVPWDENKIKVVVSKKVRADNQGQADQADKETQASITESGSEVMVNANVSKASKPVNSDLQIFVPKKAAASVDARHGDVVVQDRIGDVRVNNSNGDVSLQNITGDADVTIRPTKGSVTASNVTGNVSLDGRIEDTNISQVGGTLRMTGDFFGDMSLSKIAKGVTFKSSRTDLAFATLPGDMTMESGDLHANQLTGPVRVITRSKDIHLQNVSGEVTVQNSNGMVEVDQTSMPIGQIRIENRKGDISLILPAKANFQLQAKASRGDISSDFANLSVESKEGLSTATGAVGKGGPTIQITSEYGDVSIRKAT